jgi:hypothetical protein
MVLQISPIGSIFQSVVERREGIAISGLSLHTPSPLLTGQYTNRFPLFAPEK